MATYTAGSAEVNISPNFRNFVRDLRADLERVEAELDIEIQVDEASFDRFETSLRERLARLDLTATVNVDADTAVAASEIATLRELAGRPLTIDVDADTSGAAARIAALRDTTVSVNVVARGGPGGGGGGGDGLGFAGLLSGGAVGIAQLPAAATGIATIGADLQALAQTGLLLPGIFAGGAAALGTLVVGMQGFKDAFSDDPEKAAEAMAELSVSARSAVAAVRSYGDEWDRVQGRTQEALTTGLDNPLRQVIDAQLPVVEEGMVGIAGRMNEGVKLALGTLGSDEAKAGLSEIFSNTESAAGNLNAAIDPIIGSIGRLAATGTEKLPALADDFAGVSQRFDDWLTRADESGDLGRWMDEGIEAAKNFGSVIANVGGSLTSIFRAAKGDGDGFLVTVDRLTERWSDWLSSDEGQSEMREFFAEGREQLDNWLPILQGIGSGIGSVYGAAQEWSGVVMPFLRGAAGLLEDHSGLVQGALVAWLAWRTVTPILTGLQSVLAGATARVLAFQAASSAASTAGAGALSAGAAGLGAALGPVGLLATGIGAAVGGLLLLQNSHQDAKQAAEDQQRAVEDLGRTLQEQSGSVTQRTVEQAAQSLGERGFLDRAESFGFDTKEFVQAGVGLDPAAKQQINERLTQVILDQMGSVEGKYLALPRRLGLSDTDIAQALQGIPEAVQRYRDVVGDEAGISDLGSILAQMNDMGESAATLGGELNNTNSELGKIAAQKQQINEATNGIHELTTQGITDFQNLGLAIDDVMVLDGNTVQIDTPTEEQRAKLLELGRIVEDLPGGDIVVDLNDDVAKAAIAELVKPETKTITVQQLGVAENKTAQPIIRQGYASGGRVTGGIPNRDSVPILAMPDEVVFDHAAVDALGGPDAADRFRMALGAGLVGRYATGGIVHPQAGLPGRLSDEEIRRRQAQAAVDAANTERNRIYADPATTPQQRQDADLNYLSAQNAYEQANKPTETGEKLPEQYSLQGIFSSAGGILAEGILGAFGLENSALSSSNPYNRAVATTLGFYGNRKPEEQTPEGYAYAPQNLATGQTDSAAEAERAAKSSADDHTYYAGGGVEQWRGTFSSVLSTLGMPSSWVGLGLAQMATESGGDPKAINLWDSNAVAGTPSKGLMQVIDPTFASYRASQYPADIWDPEANIAASLNYLVARYGGPEGTWGEGHGYADGGWVPGIGGPRSDSVKARLSPREFVMNAVSAEANAPWLEAMNAGLALPAALPLPPGLTPKGGDTSTTMNRDHSVHFHGDTHVMDNRGLVREMDRHQTLQSMGALARYT